VTFCRKGRESSILDRLPPGAELAAPVNFGRARRRARKHSVPGGGEQGGGRALAEAIGAFPAHACSGGGAGDAAGSGEGVEEAELACGGPAVAAKALGRGLLAHR